MMEMMEVIVVKEVGWEGYEEVWRGVG